MSLETKYFYDLILSR